MSGLLRHVARSISELARKWSESARKRCIGRSEAKIISRVCCRITERVPSPEAWKSHVNNVLFLWNRNGFLPVFLYIGSDLFDLRLYERYSNGLRRLLNADLMLTGVRNYEMIINLADTGISKHLQLYGTWEHRSANVFEEELSKISAVRENLIAIEIGANIGYYTIMTANAVEHEVDVVAIEPNSSNHELLQKNIAINRITDRVSVHRGAIGAESGTATLQLSSKSNLHRVEHDRVGQRGGGSETVPVWGLDEFLTEHGYEPHDVTSVRMDVEGYELEILQGMTDVLSSDGPLLLYLEVHNNILNDEEIHEVLETLSDSGFEIRAVERGANIVHPFEITVDANSWDDLAEVETAYSLFIRK